MTKSVSESRSGFSLWMERRLCNGRKPFYMAAFAILGVVLIPCISVYFAMESNISYQERRNEYLRREIAILDKQIGEIKKLKSQIQSLWARKKVVEALYNARASEAAMFNFLASSVPQGVQLTRVALNHGMLEFQGLAQTDKGVAKLMRQIDETQFLANPALVSVTDIGSGSQGLQEFKIAAKVDFSAKPKKGTNPSEPVKATTVQEPGPRGSSELSPPGNSEIATLGWNGMALGVIGLIVAAALIILKWRRNKLKTANPDGSFIKRASAEFAALDPKDLSTWGLLPRVVVLFELLIFAVVISWLMIVPALDSLSSSRYAEYSLRDTYIVKKREAINLDLIKQHLTESQQAFGTLLEKLPDHFDTGGLISPIQQAAKKYGIASKTVEIGTESIVGSFAELPVQFRFVGTFDGIGNLVADLSNNKLLSNIGEFELSSEDDGGGKGRAMKLRFDAKILFHRHLTHDEIAVQQKAPTPFGAKK